MKRFYTIILIFSVFVFSCYQAPDTESTGSVSINLSAITKAAPDGYDGELKLAVYLDGVLDSYIDDSSSEISYTAELPSPLLANNSVPYTGDSGVVSLLNVPADTKLNLLVEHYGTETINDVEQYFLNYSGLSDTFEVEAGENTDVSVSLLPAAYGTGLIVTNKGTLTSSPYFRLISVEDYNEYISFSESTIDVAKVGSIYIIYGGNGSVGDTLTFTQDIIPGRKFRLIVSENSTIYENDSVGISGTFELQPGLSKSLAVTYYNSSTSGCISFS